jgi:signal transduction histidine kinase
LLGTLWTSSAADRWSGRGLDVLRAVAVMGSSGDLRQQASLISSPQTRVGLLLVVSAVAAGAARRFPLPALAVASAMDALPYWLPLAGVGFHLSFMICLYMVVSRSGRRSVVSAVIVTYALQVGLMAYEKDWNLRDDFVLLVAMSDLLAVALGLAARSRRATVRALQARAEEAERSRDSEARKRVAEDRLRVARDLHDSVAHQIAVMNLKTSVATTALPDRPEDAKRALEVVHDAGRAVLSSIGDLLSGLRQEQYGDLEARYSLDELGTLIEEFRILMPHLRSDLPDVSSLPGVRGSSINPVTYLVIRECLTNAYKHGDHYALVEVDLRVDPATDTVCVSNATSSRGVGSDAPGGPGGFGLRGMQERVAAAGGRLQVGQEDGRFTVSAVVPTGEVGG